MRRQTDSPAPLSIFNCRQSTSSRFDVNALPKRDVILDLRRSRVRRRIKPRSVIVPHPIHFQRVVMRRALPRALRRMRTRLQEFLLHRVGREILIPFDFLGRIAFRDDFTAPSRFRHSVSPLLSKLPHGRSRSRGATWLYFIQIPPHSFYDSYAHLDALPPNLIHSCCKETFVDSWLASIRSPRSCRGAGLLRSMSARCTDSKMGRAAIGESNGRTTEFLEPRQIFPPFHFFAAPILLANLIWSFFRVKPSGYSAYSIFSVFVAAALMVTLFAAR